MKPSSRPFLVRLTRAERVMLDAVMLVHERTGADVMRRGLLAEYERTAERVSEPVIGRRA